MCPAGAVFETDKRTKSTSSVAMVKWVLGLVGVALEGVDAHVEYKSYRMGTYVCCQARTHNCKHGRE